MDAVAVILLFICGFLFGIISCIAGIGGGVFFVSFMVIFYHIPIKMAIDTSAFIILISSGAGFFSYYKQERLHIKQVLFF
ncbi:MAG: TSUP family transporter, partial [Candidatus Odinarchaeota archaeon]